MKKLHRKVRTLTPSQGVVLVHGASEQNDTCLQEKANNENTYGPLKPSRGEMLVCELDGEMTPVSREEI